ncbi:MAG: hypothetical protein M1823_008497, partial [Watsoniomyces obsoletus]
MNRSVSVREAARPTPQTTPGTLAGTPEVNEGDQQSSSSKRGTRHTLQAEYVEPQTHTTRVQPASHLPAPVNLPHTGERSTVTTQAPPMTSKPLPQEPPRSQADQARAPVS